jgi:AAT family amino acid transporter
MTDAPLAITAQVAESANVVGRESGLHRKLSARQVAMIGLGCSIGTGLFLGSAIAVKLAGPAVLISFVGGGLVALTVMWALAEMSVAHPSAGTFGCMRRCIFIRGPVLRFAIPTGCA